MSEEEIRKIARETIRNTLMDKLDSSLIFTYVSNLEKENQLLKHRLEVADQYIESRKENMIQDHYDDLKYIVNECDLESSW